MTSVVDVTERPALTSLLTLFDRFIALKLFYGSQLLKPKNMDYAGAARTEVKSQRCNLPHVKAASKLQMIREKCS